MSDEQKAVYEKAKANMNQIGCGIEKLHEQGLRGRCAMALLDQKYCPHKIFSDKVRGTTDIGTNVDSPQGPSWHAAGMLSVMHKTAPDAEIVHYNVTDMNVVVQDEQFAQAIKDIIEKNKTLPDDKKVRTIVMGWGFTPQNPKYDEYINLCKEAVESGIFISSNNAPELYGIYTMGVDRNPKGDVNSPQSYKLASFDNVENHKGILPKYHHNLLHFPM